MSCWRAQIEFVRLCAKFQYNAGFLRLWKLWGYYFSFFPLSDVKRAIFPWTLLNTKDSNKRRWRLSEGFFFFFFLLLLALCGEGCNPPGMIYSTSQLVDKSAGDLKRKQRTLCPGGNTVSTVWDQNLPSRAAQAQTLIWHLEPESPAHILLFFSLICTRKGLLTWSRRATTWAAASNQAFVWPIMATVY